MGPDGKITITKEIVKECLQSRITEFDKNGDSHYDNISAFIKSMRGSSPDGALFYLARAINAGEDPMFLAKNYGPDIEKHPYFPEKTNTEFVKIISRSEIDMRVYERGCGITLACGTGACASVVACVLNNLTEQNVKVNLLGGAVTVEWSGTYENPNRDIYLIGPANYSFTADYML